MNLSKRVGKLEANAQRSDQIASTLRPRLIRAYRRLYAQEVAEGTRKPEDATDSAILAHLKRPHPMFVGGLAERLRAAKQALRDALEVCHG